MRVITAHTVNGVVVIRVAVRVDTRAEEGAKAALIKHRETR